MLPKDINKYFWNRDVPEKKQLFSKSKFTTRSVLISRERLTNR